MSYELPPSNIAGARRRPPAAEPGLFVDYADVLEQAKINEREKLLRELEREVRQLRTQKSYNEPEYNRPTAESVQKSVLRLIRERQS